MTIASDLLQRHFQTLVQDNSLWQTLIADDLVWELPYAPAIGHPARLSGRDEVVRHVTWFLGAVENFRFFDATVHPFADPGGAVAEVKAEALIKATGRTYRQVTWCSCVPSAGGSPSYASTSTLRAPPRHWTRQFLISNPDLPRDGHAVLAGAGGDGDEGVAMR
jgi:ketosteroid isomerase-like protein